MKVTKERKKLIFDTNWLVYCAKEKNFERVDWLLHLYECYILKKTFDEMKSIHSWYKKRIELMIDYLEQKIKKHELLLIKSERDVDSSILALVKKKFADAVATFDSELIEKIKAVNPKIEIIEKIKV
ncbi:MAG: hypothetical protein QXE64_02165 [Candidatus Pacearchaeota archaeon]